MGAIMGAQMGKTAMVMNIIGHKLDDDPAPILYIGPTKSQVDSMVEPQIDYMLRSSPSLWAKTLKGRKAQKLVKRIAGVTLRLAWAGSATELASQPVHTVIADEVDRMEPLPGEGDPVTLAAARIFTYPDGRLIVTSTPTEGNVTTAKHPVTGIEHWEVVEPDQLGSQVWRFFQTGTRHEWAVPCPDCHEYFIPRFKLLWWPKGCTAHRARLEARLTCAACGVLIEDKHRPSMNAKGFYLAPGQQVKHGAVVGDIPPNDTATFWASGLMSAFVSWGERAAAWILAVQEGDQDKIRTTLNTNFGELFRVGADAPQWESVRSLCLAYLAGEMPTGVVVITCGVDVQKNRLIYAIRGWGYRSESWLIETGELWGETERNEVWGDLAELLERKWGGHQIRRMGIDSGYRPGDKWKRPDNQVYNFCRQHAARVIATKGHDSLSKPLAPSTIDVTYRGQLIKNGLQLWHMDSDYFKSWVHNRLQWPADQPGAWHLPSNVTDDYCQQVTAEARTLKPSGRAIWIKVRKDNHYLDCEAINVAVAHSLGAHRAQPKGEPAPVVPAARQELSMPKRKIPVRGFVKGWRK